MRNAGPFCFREVSEYFDGFYKTPGELCQGTSNVVEDPDSGCRPNRILIQIREHLLASMKATVLKQHYRYGLVSEFRIFADSRFDGSPAMLPIVDDELGGHRDHETA
jgi:hypothetical protein